MKRIAIVIFLLAGMMSMASAQTAHRSSRAAAHKKLATPPAAPIPPAEVVQLPAGIPPASQPVKTAFALRYQDIVEGTGLLAEPSKLYRVHYTGWLASDGAKFDSSYDHPESPMIGNDGKPANGEDGKPKMAPAQPLFFVQGMRQMLAGFDQGFGGMHIGGKRRLFIPWQLAYGAQGRPNSDPKKTGIPPMADLIFDVELMGVSEVPVRPQPTPPTPRPGSAFPFKNGMPPGSAPPAGANTPSSVPATASGSPAATGNGANPATAAKPASTSSPASTVAPAAGSTQPSAPVDPTKPTGAAPQTK